jgi:hypothetical protein
MLDFGAFFSTHGKTSRIQPISITTPENLRIIRDSKTDIFQNVKRVSLIHSLSFFYLISLT